VIQCPFCQTSYVTNTIFCEECGMYLLGGDELGTDPFKTAEVTWPEEDDSYTGDMDLTDSEPITIHLRIDKGAQARELEISLSRPIRLGRIDPTQDIFPEVDLTDDLGMEHGVSREHARISQEGNVVEVEDLGSTNGTLLNGNRLAPYISHPLKDGDRLQIGKLIISVSLKFQGLDKTLPGNSPPSDGVYRHAS
jgi:hypothetical protein